MTTSPIEVRRIRVDEWFRLREIRLEALADAPGAFITTLSEAEAQPDTVWRERARSGAFGGNQTTMLAIDGERTVGMAIGVLRPSLSRDVAPIVSVFVSPPLRGRGVGEALVVAVERWAWEQGAVRTSLWVVDTNDAARRFYERIGYRATRDRQKITVPPVRWETCLVKDLTPSG